MSEKFEMGLSVLEHTLNLYDRDGLCPGKEYHCGEYVLEHAYEIPEMPPGVRPIIVQKDGGGYDIKFQAYCVICGRVFEDEGYISRVDINSAQAVLGRARETDDGSETYDLQVLEDGRIVCAWTADNDGNCCYYCRCNECLGIGKTIGVDQEDCKSAPVSRSTGK